MKLFILGPTGFKWFIVTAQDLWLRSGKRIPLGPPPQIEFEFNEPVYLGQAFGMWWSSCNETTFVLAVLAGRVVC